MAFCLTFGDRSVHATVQWQEVDERGDIGGADTATAHLFVSNSTEAVRVLIHCRLSTSMAP